MRQWTQAIFITSAVFLMGMTNAEETAVTAPREIVERATYVLPETKVEPVAVATKEVPAVPTKDTVEVEVKKPTASSTFYIVSEPLNKRKTANVDHKPIGYLEKGQPVEGIKLLSNGWVKLADNSYVNGKYLIIKSSMTRDQFNERLKKFNEAKKAKPKTTNKGKDSVGRKGKVVMSAKERDLLARLVRAEAGGEKYEGMVAVAAVVFNRVTSSRFPNSVQNVIYAKNQFSPVANGSINKPASDIHYKAVDDALTRDNTNGALFFYAPSLVKSRYMESLTTVKVIGVHHFKK